MNGSHASGWLAGLAVLSVFIFQFSFSSCNPEANWETEDVVVTMNIKTVSAGFVECSFSTNKDAYYLIAICEPWEDYNPLANQKQFMQLALDSAYAEYLLWRNGLLRSKEFNVASFSSHSLQYGDVNHFFTGLLPDRNYWVFAFPVNPLTMEPTGKLVLQPVTTTTESIMDVHFEYRVKGMWDYIYPVDTLGNIFNRFPYLAITCDSLKLTELELGTDSAAVVYFVFWMLERFTVPDSANVIYGVHAVENDGVQSSEAFQKGHTYYTAISGYDGSYKQTTIYKFTWTGDSCDLYLRDTDPENIVNQFRE